MNLFARPAPSGGGRLYAQLDALRGVAILAVFAQHLGDRFMPFVEERIALTAPAWLAPWILTVLHHAYWGVDLFFVLSGFSLAQSYLSAFERRGRATPTRHFFLRRAARIFPAFLAALALVIAVRPRVIHMPGFAAAVAAHLSLLQGYVTPGDIVFIGAAWSLTTEAHFYLLLPVLARPLLFRDERAPHRRWLFGAALVVGAWSARALLHHLVLEEGVRTALFELTQRRLIVSRLDQFVLGAMAAATHRALAQGPFAARAARAAPIALLASLLALPFAFRLEGELYLSPGGSWPYALVSLATTALVLSASLCQGRTLAIIAPRPLAGLGIVSYGFFLNHQLALGLVGKAWGPESRTWTSLCGNALLALALSVVMGAVSWVFIERPAMAWMARREGVRPRADAKEATSAT